MDSRIKSGVPGIVCKIDFEKAFDHVSWDFVDEVLKQMGFQAKWRSWIQGCIGNTPLSALINGSAHSKFITGKGLRQGDTMSPFLFLIFSEALNLMLQKSVELGWIGGFRLGESGIKVGHLQFAEDTLVFLDESRDQVNALRYLLLLFEISSGLRINFSKTSMFGIAGATNISGLAEMMGCRSELMPTTYLGLPLGQAANNNAMWDPIIENCIARLPNWIRSSLTKAGKLTLVKSVLSSVPIYMFSLFAAPMKVIKALEKVIRDFLWDPSDTKKGYHLVAFNKMRTPSSMVV